MAVESRGTVYFFFSGLQVDWEIFFCQSVIGRLASVSKWATTTHRLEEVGTRSS